MTLPFKKLALLSGITIGVFTGFSIATLSDTSGSFELGDSETSPVRRISPSLESSESSTSELSTFGSLSVDPSSMRSIDGSGNNLDDPAMNKAFAQLTRWSDTDYGDGMSAMAGNDRPGARELSNAVNAQDRLRPNREGISDYFWQWGQFLDHDIDLTDGVNPAEPAHIQIPQWDPEFDPDGDGTIEMPFNRSIYDTATGGDTTNPRQQMNQITGWIDASNVYGASQARANALRANDGTGRLKVSAGNLLPFNTDGFPNAGGPSPTLFLAGDVRANEQVGLTAMHTLFMREHNRLATNIAAANPGMGGDDIYQKARQIVGAQVQFITYNEFLPILLGKRALSDYEGYNPGLNARISNVFSTAAYRFGHSALGAKLLRLDANGDETTEGHLPLRYAFFAPWRITDEGGIEPLLRGLANQPSQPVDIYIVDDVRNFLFGPPGSGGFDLAALNIQRGRDHGLPSYNDMRKALGLKRARSFSDISSKKKIRRRLASVYNRPNDVDLWVGGLAEDRERKAQVGELFYKIINMQFNLLRDGDRFWYARTLSKAEKRMVEDTRLSDIIRRNTTIGDEIPGNVFYVESSDEGDSDS